MSIEYKKEIYTSSFNWKWKSTNIFCLKIQIATLPQRLRVFFGTSLSSCTWSLFCCSSSSSSSVSLKIPGISFNSGFNCFEAGFWTLTWTPVLLTLGGLTLASSSSSSSSPYTPAISEIEWDAFFRVVSSCLKD